MTTSLLLAGYHAHISPITPGLRQQMIHGGSWHKGCPVPLSDLRYLSMTYRGFDGKDHRGEMIVHQSIANEVTEIFGKLYDSGYPIHRMLLVSHYGGSDFRSIEADNTSAFNCRPVTGGRKWSKHSYGKAIDINPIENPYISRSGHIAHKASLQYRSRKHYDRHNPYDHAVILPHDRITTLMKQYGWRWGGDWHSIKDYQHFEKNVRNRTTAKKRGSSAVPSSAKAVKRSPKKLFGELEGMF